LDSIGSLNLSFSQVFQSMFSFFVFSFLVVFRKIQPGPGISGLS
jgi:hypothetical protein